MTVQTPSRRSGGGYLERPAPSGLADVVETILDKGIVIDAYVRVSLVGIELLTEIADALLERLVGIGKRKWLEASVVAPPRSILQRRPGSSGPDHLRPRRKNGQTKGITRSDCEKRVIRQHVGVQKNEEPVLGSLRRCDESR